MSVPFHKSFEEYIRRARMNGTFDRAVFVVFLFLALIGFAGMLVPATITAQFYRTEAGADIPGTFPAGSAAYADASGDIVRDLQDVRVLLSVGDFMGATTTTGTVNDVSGGVFSGLVTIPTNRDFVVLQVSLIDTVKTVRFDYPERKIKVRPLIGN